MTDEGFGPRPQDLIAPLRVGERYDARRAHFEEVHWSILGGPAFEDEVKLRQVELVDVAQQRQTSRTWQIVQCALCHDPIRSARKPRNVGRGQKKNSHGVSPLFSACWHEPEPVLLRAEGEDAAKGAAHRPN